MVIIPAMRIKEEVCGSGIQDHLKPQHQIHDHGDALGKSEAISLREDKARLHVVRAAMNCLTSCQTLPWPARSLFNRACLGYMIGIRLYLPGNVDDLAQ
ncbi:hypothetical protein TNCV_2099091 [Trichonephila clavipes]|nr:hypothetical protein TNCV_2099091 [Trichonephila clavipes]